MVGCEEPFTSASRSRRWEPDMDAGQFVIPILGIVGAAAATFYAVSFMEIREKSLEDLDDKYSEYEEGGGRQRRARRRSGRQAKKRND
ncbi:uncharacterized protein LOC119356760 [Triticum dicoccoides]|uniref:uncharacterized protein LOC119356760 n=1 Tax=Triticum dicoccoides TaxID=85692 RepID=UPI000E7893E8|nr:uncharacterized protein LOC119356760 [Triticum dicoccoides]